ncbi:MAG TPA: hypothetical protein PK831_02690 [Candidatus Magasanikbacteria bacterium]|jgi:hypothetical protein|nr:DUF805 domain-containing protein [Candidatus Magasanikbacteria bacterium]HQF57385.1 hypothetical protein [Candidatus Magasanikbacteria bacterium]HQL52425.1 hypothetical protein [Candidatus Magasanikbacteria bacterium]
MNLEKFITLKEGEKVIEIIKRAGITLFWDWFLVFILLVTPFFFMFWLFRHDWWGITLFILPIVLSLFLIVKIIFVWQRNIFIITTHRLVDINQKGFFHKEISKITYDQVEDIFGSIKGFWGTLFRYGKVIIQTGNGQIEIIVDKIKSPIQIQEIIQDNRDRFMSKYVHNYSEDVAENIRDQIYELELTDLYKIKKIVNKRITKLESVEENEE